MSLVFEPPSPPTRGRTVWIDRLVPLMDHPGEWVNLTKTYGLTEQVNVAQTSATRLRKRTMTRPDGRWEFRASGPCLYGRYLGPDESEENH